MEIRNLFYSQEGARPVRHHHCATPELAQAVRVTIYTDCGEYPVSETAGECLALDPGGITFVGTPWEYPKNGLTGEVLDLPSLPYKVYVHPWHVAGMLQSITAGEADGGHRVYQGIPAFRCCVMSGLVVFPVEHLPPIKS